MFSFPHCALMLSIGENKSNYSLMHTKNNKGIISIIFLKNTTGIDVFNHSPKALGLNAAF